MSAEIIRREQDGSALSSEDQAAFDGIVNHYDNIPEEYRALTDISEEERYREALNPQQASPEEWESLSPPRPEVLSEEPRLPDQEYIQQRLAAMTAKFRETQALLPPYEDKVRWEVRNGENPSMWKRVTSFFSRRKGSERAWSPKQREIVSTLAMGSTAIIRVDPNYLRRYY